MCSVFPTPAESTFSFTDVETGQESPLKPDIICSIIPSQWGFISYEFIMRSGHALDQISHSSDLFAAATASKVQLWPAKRRLLQSYWLLSFTSLQMILEWEENLGRNLSSMIIPYEFCSQFENTNASIQVFQRYESETRISSIFSF